MNGYGPVDVLVVSVPQARFDGRLLATIEQPTKNGSIRVLDAMLIVMDDDGTIRGLDVEDLGPRDAEILGFTGSKTRGMFDSSNAAEYTEGMVPGSAVIAMAIENTWVTALKKSLAGVGAGACFFKRATPQAVHEAFGDAE